MTHDPNKEIIDRYLKAIDDRIKTTERLITKKENKLTVLMQQRDSLKSMIQQQAAMKTKDHVPTDEDTSMVRVPWILLAAIDTLVAHAGNDETIVAKELRKYTDDDAEVRESGAQAFYEDHSQRVPPHAEG